MAQQPQYKFTTAETIRESTGITPEAWDDIRRAIEATFRNIKQRADLRLPNDEITSLEYFLNTLRPASRLHAAVGAFMLARELHRYDTQYHQKRTIAN
jgi:hypothetical protein